MSSPEYFQSTPEYEDKLIVTYTAEFKKRGLAKFMLDAEWINSREYFSFQWGMQSR